MKKGQPTEYVRGMTTPLGYAKDRFVFPDLSAHGYYCPHLIHSWLSVCPAKHVQGEFYSNDERLTSSPVSFAIAGTAGLVVCGWSMRRDPALTEEMDKTENKGESDEGREWETDETARGNGLSNFPARCQMRCMTTGSRSRMPLEAGTFDTQRVHRISRSAVRSGKRLEGAATNVRTCGGLCSLRRGSSLGWNVRGGS